MVIVAFLGFKVVLLFWLTNSMQIDMEKLEF